MALVLDAAENLAELNLDIIQGNIQNLNVWKNGTTSNNLNFILLCVRVDLFLEDYSESVNLIEKKALKKLVSMLIEVNLLLRMSLPRLITPSRHSSVMSLIFTPRQYHISLRDPSYLFA